MNIIEGCHFHSSLRILLFRDYLFSVFLSLVQEVKFAFSIYDTESKNSIDACLLGDLLRACELNPTNALIEKMGGTKKKGTVPAFLHENEAVYSLTSHNYHLP